MPLTPLGFVGAYVEAFWMLAPAAFADQLLDEVWAWVESRRAVSIVLDWWLTVLDALGPVAAPGRRGRGLGGRRARRPRRPRRHPARVAHRRRGRLRAQARGAPRARAARAPGAWQRVPAPVRRWSAEPRRR